MFAQRQRYSDVNAHAGAILGWQQTYDQMSAGSVNTELFHLTADRFQVFSEVLDKRVVQQGTAPQGRLCLAMPVGGSSTNVFQGTPVGGSDVTVLHSGQEFFVHASEGMQLLALSVDISRLQFLAEREFTTPELRKLSRCTRVNVSPQFLYALRKQLQTLVTAAVQGEALLESQIEDLLLECTLVLLEQMCEADSKRSGNVAVNAYLVRQTHQMIMECLDEPLSILQICDSLNVSRSTLQRSFLSVTGLRPVEYLRVVRLNAVRQRLQQTRADEFNIARVACDFGFTHLGHFSGAYRRLFDQSPSDTPRLQ